jgi:hypothetical protein
MKETAVGKAIPKDMAFQLCEEIRKEKAGKRFTQCWGCVKFSKGDPAKMCLSSRPDYRGCKLVNECYDHGPEPSNGLT